MYSNILLSMDMHNANRTKGGRPAKTTSERDRQQDEGKRGRRLSLHILEEARQEGLEGVGAIIKEEGNDSKKDAAEDADEGHEGRHLLVGGLVLPVVLIEVLLMLVEGLLDLDRVSVDVAQGTQLVIDLFNLFLKIALALGRRLPFRLLELPNEIPGAVDVVSFLFLDEGHDWTGSWYSLDTMSGVGVDVQSNELIVDLRSISEGIVSGGGGENPSTDVRV